MLYNGITRLHTYTRTYTCTYTRTQLRNYTPTHVHIQLQSYKVENYTVIQLYSYSIDYIDYIFVLS